MLEKNIHIPQTGTNKSGDVGNRIGDILSTEDLERLGKQIEEIISSNFIKKEYYPNFNDGSNPEIEKVWKLSPIDIKQRMSEGKGIFYMNTCISQTLYLINILKAYPELKDKINLCIEQLEGVDGNYQSHSFIKIDIYNTQSLIIDYNRNNNVYIYIGSYKNRLGCSTYKIISIPSINFTETDNIFDILIGYFNQFIEKNQNVNLGENMVEEIKKKLAPVLQKLIKDNTSQNFASWEAEGNSQLRIHNFLCDRNG